MHTEASFTEVNILTKFSKIISKLAKIKSLEITEVQSEAWLLLAELDPLVVVTDSFFEKKLLQKVTDLTKSCGLGRGSKWGCVTSLTGEDRSTIEVGSIAYISTAHSPKNANANGPQKGSHIFPGVKKDFEFVSEFGDSAEDVFFEKLRMEAEIAELPDRARQLLETLEASLNGNEILAKHGANLQVQSLSVLNRRIAKEVKLASEPTTQASLF